MPAWLLLLVIAGGVWLWRADRLRIPGLAWPIPGVGVGWWLGGGLVLLVIGGLGGWWLWRWLQQMALRRARTRAGRLRTLQALDPLAFERHVGQWFAQAGYRVSLTPHSGDEGIDLWLEGPAFAGRRSLLARLKALVVCGRASRIPVQCKRYGPDHAVGSPELQTFSGALRRVRAETGIFVTTSRFTAAAVTWARKEGIHLIDGQALARAQRWRLPEDAQTSVAPAAAGARKD